MARTKLGASASRIVPMPKIVTASEHDASDAAEIGQRVRISAVMMAPAAGAARNTPKPSGPACENIAGEDRQQRRGVAEQHGKQIEQDGAKHDLVAADEDDAAEQRFQIDRRRAVR